MNSELGSLLSRLAEVSTVAEAVACCLNIRRLCEAKRVAVPFSELAEALATHLMGCSDHPRFQRWVRSHFGRPEPYLTPLQRPTYIYYPALEPKPFFEASQLEGLAPLRLSLGEIREEIRALVKVAPESYTPYVGHEALRTRLWRDLANQDAWSAIHLIRRGEWRTDIARGLPVTRAVLADTPLANCPPHAPECFVSRLRPGTVLPPHHGLSNIKLTVHLPVLLPKGGCYLTVAGQRMPWRYDELLVFDDSFLHSAANESDEDRVVLILDIWNPLLDAAEHVALAHAVRVIDAAQSIVPYTQRASRP